MKEIIDKIAKLIDVKSLITLAFGIAFIVFTYMQITTGEQFYNILMIIIIKLNFSFKSFF